jgi:hypothetical protein
MGSKVIQFRKGARKAIPDIGYHIKIQDMRCWTKD